MTDLAVCVSPDDWHARVLAALAEQAPSVCACPNPTPAHDLVAAVVAAHAPCVDPDDDTIAWCNECFNEDADESYWTWPCRFYRLAAQAVAVHVT